MQTFNADVAMVYEPDLSSNFHSLAAVEQQLHVQFCSTHPLNQEGPARLRDCLEWPLALPTKSNGIRYQLEQAVAIKSTNLNVTIETEIGYRLID